MWLLIVPLVVFGTLHMLAARGRRNRRAVRVGYVLFGASLIVLISGLLLMRIGGFDLKQPQTRTVVYWLHVVAPLAAAWLYWLHRLSELVVQIDEQMEDTENILTAESATRVGSRSTMWTMKSFR